jgi:hypothetical protein
MTTLIADAASAKLMPAVGLKDASRAKLRMFADKPRQATEMRVATARIPRWSARSIVDCVEFQVAL